MAGVKKSYQCYAAAVLAVCVLCFFNALLTARPGNAQNDGTEGRRAISLGLMAELTGNFAANGQNCRRGFELARHSFAPEDRVGKYDLKLIYVDSQGEPKVAVSEFKRLLASEHISALITTRSQIGMVLNPISRQSRVPLLGTVGARDFVKNNPYAYRFYPSTTREGGAVAAKMIAMGFKRAAAITAQDEWNLDLTDAFAKRFAASGGHVAANEIVISGEMDYAGVIERIKQAKPEALYVNLGIVTSGAALKKIGELGLNVPLFANFWAGAKEAIDVAGAGAEGVVFVETDLRLPKFSAGLVRLFGEPSASAVTFACYGALAAVLEALQKNSAIENPQMMQAALAELKSVPLLDQTLPLVEHEALFPLSYKVIRRGEIQTLEPVDES